MLDCILFVVVRRVLVCPQPLRSPTEMATPEQIKKLIGRESAPVDISYTDRYSCLVLSAA